MTTQTASPRNGLEIQPGDRVRIVRHLSERLVRQGLPKRVVAVGTVNVIDQWCVELADAGCPGHRGFWALGDDVNGSTSVALAEDGA